MMSEEQRQKIMQLVEIINRYERVDFPLLGEKIERLLAELAAARLMIGKEIAAHAYTTAELQLAREALMAAASIVNEYLAFGLGGFDQEIAIIREALKQEKK
jgi:hypothetical protein